VARVGQVPIFGSQVLAEARRTGKPVGEALADLVTFHLLAERGRQSGWRPAAGSEREVKSMLVQRLLERELEPRMRPEAVPDSVLRPLYDRAKDTFVHSRLVEVGLLAIYTGVRMIPQARNERTAGAKALAAYLQEHPPATLDAFAAIARDPAWSSRHVVYSRFLQSLHRPLSPAVGAQIAKLRVEGEMTPMLSDDNGFYIARYLGERPAENISFAQARPRLLAGYLERWRQQQFQEYTGRGMHAHNVVAFFDRLSE